MKIIANYKRHKMKQNSENHKKNERNKNEYCQSSRTNNIQWDENVETQDYARNELIITTQLENWLKTKKNHNEKLWIQDQINSNKIMNED